MEMGLPPDLAERVAEQHDGAGDDVLVLRHVTKTFGARKALDDVDLTVRRGEVHALLGQNGSGKSTLIKLLSGFHQPDRGAEAWLRGEEFSLGDREVAQAQIRFVHQDLALIPELDSVENLALGQRYSLAPGWRIRWNHERERAARELHALGFDFDVRRPVGGLAAAQKVGLAVARALRGWEAAPPAVLVLDEPTAALPADEVDLLFGVIERVTDRGVAVLYVSHRLGEVFEIGTRVTVLRDGRRVGTERVADLDHDRIVEMITAKRAATGRPLCASGPDRPVTIAARAMSGGGVSTLDLEVRAGEVVGFAGLDGSGRESVANLLFGVTTSRSGTLEVDGRTIEAHPATCRRAGVALVPADRQQSAMLEGFTVRENLTLVDLRPFWRRGRLNGGAERGEAMSWIKRLGIVPRDTEQTIDYLSGGNQQRVLVAKWLRITPRVLIADNPTQGVDVAAKEALYALFEDAARSGASILVCSNDADELARLCSRVLVLRDGRIVAEMRGQLEADQIEREVLGVDHKETERD